MIDLLKKDADDINMREIIFQPYLDEFIGCFSFLSDFFETYCNLTKKQIKKTLNKLMSGEIIELDYISSNKNIKNKIWLQTGNKFLTDYGYSIDLCLTFIDYKDIKELDDFRHDGSTYTNIEGMFIRYIGHMIEYFNFNYDLLQNLLNKEVDLIDLYNACLLLSKNGVNLENLI